MKSKTYKIHTITAESLNAFAATQTDVFYLDSCGISDALKLGKYEIVFGYGIRDAYNVEVNHIIDWSKVNAFSMGKDWCFAVLGYDMKNQLEKLESLNSNTLNWPILSMVLPEVVITLSKESVLEIWADEPEPIFQLLSKAIIPSKHHLALSYDEMSASMPMQEYLLKVEQIKNEISEGNVYEMNLCFEYLLSNFQINDAFALFNELKSHSPSPFSAYVHLGQRHILCASPERFICKDDSFLYSQPIKGTSPRYANVLEDEASRMNLIGSEKDLAEHIMIVDLVRNDLSKSGLTGQTTVEELCAVYPFAQVFQMISTVKCKLKAEISFEQILKNCFPMGSMTGAPKHIAMKFIDQFESRSRGTYSGSIGYIEPGGNFDFNVIIRSLMFDSFTQTGTYSTGGAITFDSDAEAEYNECMVKISAIQQLLLRFKTA